MVITGPLAEDTEEFHPDAGGITISSTPGRSDTSLSTSTSDHTHDGLWIPDHAREDRWRSTVQPPDDHSADDPWGSSHARPDVCGKSVLMSAPDDHKIDRSIQLSTPVIQVRTEAVRKSGKSQGKNVTSCLDQCRVTTHLNIREFQNIFMQKSGKFTKKCPIQGKVRGN